MDNNQPYGITNKLWIRMEFQIQHFHHTATLKEGGLNIHITYRYLKSISSTKVLY